MILTISVLLKINDKKMSKTWLETQKRPLDMNFDIKTFRTQIKDKIRPCGILNSESSYQKFSSAK